MMIIDDVDVDKNETDVNIGTFWHRLDSIYGKMFTHTHI